MKRPVPYVRKNSLSSGDPESPQTYSGGYNGTAVEQATAANEFSDSKNMFSDTTGGIYVRPGSRLLGGVIHELPCYGVFQFKTNELVQIELAIFGTALYWFSGNTWVPVVGASSLPAKNVASGVFFAETDAFYITNGVDPGIKITVVSSVPTAVASPGPVCRYLAVHGRSILYLGTTAPNLIVTSYTGTDTYNAASLANVQGAIMGCVPLTQTLSLLITSQRLYRLGPVHGLQLPTIQDFVYSPSFTDIGLSRCIAALSIAVVNQCAYWLGTDELNGFEIYRSEGQQILGVGSLKLKQYLQFVNSAQVSTAAACQYGHYYKLSIPSQSTVGSSEEWLLDTYRSNFFYYNLSQLNPIWEGKHVPGYVVSMYAVYTSAGRDFVLAGDATVGCVHRQGVTYQDELVTTSLLGTSIQAYTAVGPQTYIAQPLAANSIIQTVSIRAGSQVAGSTISISIQSSKGGNPSGTLVTASAIAQATWTAAVTNIPSTVVSVTFTSPITVPVGSYLVISSSSPWTVQVSGGTSVAGTAVSFINQAWIPYTGQLAVALTTLQPITALVTKTTSLENVRSKKRTVQMIVTGQSVLGATPIISIGTQGRDSQFTGKPVSLVNKGGLWAQSVTDATPPDLQWAPDPSNPQSFQVWQSLSASYSQTVFAPMYLSPSVYISYQFSYTGTSDWRISSFTPIVDTYPSTIV